LVYLYTRYNLHVCIDTDSNIKINVANFVYINRTN
jgi:hypothetical protein